jgi:hypothetical protein
LQSEKSILQNLCNPHSIAQDKHHFKQLHYICKFLQFHSIAQDKHHSRQLHYIGSGIAISSITIVQAHFSHYNRRQQNISSQVPGRALPAGLVPAPAASPSESCSWGLSIWSTGGGVARGSKEGGGDSGIARG